MKLLSIVVDDKTLFSGEVNSVSWQEDEQTVTVTGKFGSQPSVLQQLQAAMAGGRKLSEPSGSVPTSPASLDVVRGEGEES